MRREVGHFDAPDESVRGRGGVVSGGLGEEGEVLTGDR